MARRIVTILNPGEFKEFKMKIKKALFYLLTGILAGCVPVLSLNPLYDNQHLVFEEKIVGTFVDANDSNVTWGFARSNEPNTYQLTFSSIEDQNLLKGLFTVHLVKLNECLFLDVFPKEAPWGDDKETGKAKWPYNSFFCIPAHTFIKIEALEPRLKLRLTDNDSIKKLLKENPNAINHEMVDDKPLLTASTPKLQAFVLKYKDDNRLFANELALVRKQAEPNAPHTPDVSSDSNRTGK